MILIKVKIKEKIEQKDRIKVKRSSYEQGREGLPCIICSMVLIKDFFLKIKETIEKI